MGSSTRYVLVRIRTSRSNHQARLSFQIALVHVFQISLVLVFQTLVRKKYEMNGKRFSALVDI